MRNRSIDVYKFIFCLVIALLHFYKGSGAHLIGGGIAVEFYVMSAAWFFYRKLEKESMSQAQNSCGANGMDNIAYIKQRFIRFFPYTTAALLMDFFIRRIWIFTRDGGVLTLGKIYRWFSRDIWDYLLISLSGLNANTNMLNGPLWTISAMLICELVVWGLYQNNKKVFRSIIAPVSILFVLAYWKNIQGTADNKAWMGFTTFGVIRVFGCYCLTLFIWENAKKLREMGSRLTNKARVLLTLCEFGCLSLAIANMEYSDSRYFRYVNILLFFIALSITFSGQSYGDKVFSNGKISKYLGELSFAVYLAHGPVLEVFRVLYPDPAVLDSHIGLFLCVVILLSAVFDIIMKWVVAFSASIIKRVTSSMILSSAE